ncbi:MAG: type 2 isopentenyl-diphosphate Delta-isomerase [Candidatus Thorarchaeota archaeon]
MSHFKDKQSKRKDEHLEIACDSELKIEMNCSNGFEDIIFIHKALPEMNFTEISTTTEFLGTFFDYPIFISSITGGTPLALEINKKLAQAAEELKIGIGVGSQRSALLDPSTIASFKIIREHAPNAFIAANIGAVQLNNDITFNDIEKAIDMISADALTLHLNPLQEIIQPEGNKNFENIVQKISDLAQNLDCPIIVKEVGSGFSLEDGMLLVEAGVKAIEIAGAGGTSWAKIEAIRALRENKISSSKLGELFSDWGIPTAASTIEISALKNKIDIISSGGIRNGLEGAKAIALGAKLFGMALPVVRIAKDDTVRQLIEFLNQIIQEFKTTMFLVGAKSISELHEVPLAIIGRTAQWLSARGLE